MSQATPAPVLLVAEPPAQYLPRPPMVVDCSALAGVLFQEPWMDQALQRLSGHRLYAPHLLQAEICSVAVKKARGGAAEAAAAGSDAVGVPESDPCSIPSARSARTSRCDHASAPSPPSMATINTRRITLGRRDGRTARSTVS